MADRRYAAETRLPVLHKRVKFGSKILSRWGKYCQKTLGGVKFYTHAVGYMRYGLIYIG